MGLAGCPAWKQHGVNGKSAEPNKGCCAIELKRLRNGWSLKNNYNKAVGLFNWLRANHNPVTFFSVRNYQSRELKTTLLSKSKVCCLYSPNQFDKISECSEKLPGI